MKKRRRGEMAQVQTQILDTCCIIDWDMLRCITVTQGEEIHTLHGHTSSTLSALYNMLLLEAEIRRDTIKVNQNLSVIVTSIHFLWFNMADAPKRGKIICKKYSHLLYETLSGITFYDVWPWIIHNSFYYLLLKAGSPTLINQSDLLCDLNKV